MPATAGGRRPRRLYGDRRPRRRRCVGGKGGDEGAVSSEGRLVNSSPLDDSQTDSPAVAIGKARCRPPKNRARAEIQTASELGEGKAVAAGDLIGEWCGAVSGDRG